MNKKDSYMKIIAVISQKGGSGKTTLALHLAVATAAAGKNTAIIDLDPQASATKWSDRREAELPVVISAHASRLPNEIQRIKDAGCEILFLDTAPHSDSAALEAAKIADVVLVPCRPAIMDMEAITNTLDLIRTKNAAIYVVMNATSAQGQEAKEAIEAIAQLEVSVCPIQLVNRVAFSRSIITGQTAQEIEPSGKAAKEISDLHLFMCAHMNKCNTKSEEKGNHVKQIRQRA
ncbi:ParA family partition ATPase [uncultured Nitrosomonas sp.]|uniref:ParA family partition ATPase n=1 Tax=uncultured Nitrosomonas sp. TaxID=156424 RepID=UPI0025E0D59D|nr:ParA family partition ATPase [uncultured Nitrosomonas sp.]